VSVDLVHYYVTDPVTLTTEFRVNGTLTDPTAVTATAIQPDGTETVYTYGVSPELTKTAIGVYNLAITASIVGVWYVIFKGTGAAAGSERHSFIVDPRVPSDLLKDFALTSVERVELELDRVGSQGGRANEEDDKRYIAELINAFSEEIRKHTRRQFKPTEDAVTKKLLLDGVGPSFSLAPYEARAITGVSLYSDSTAPTVVAATGYRLGPRQKSSVGTYLALTLVDYPNRSWDGVEIALTGDWGAGVVPDTVAYVCAAEVANAYVRASQRPARGAEQDFLGPDLGPFALSRRAEAKLEAYVNGRPGLTTIALRG
jgi:hypothetical protein